MIAQMANNDAQVAAEFEGLKIPKSPFVNHKLARMLSNGNYERPERKLAAKLTRDGDKVVELGTGIGFVGGYTAFTKRDLTLFSFEGNPSLIPHASTLYEINGLAKRASVENAIVIANPQRPDTLTFHVNRAFMGSAILGETTRGYEKIEVPTVAWDDVRVSRTPDVLIMDIEGAELDFLIHADLAGVRAIIFEVHPGRYGKEGEAACINALREKGMVQAHHRMHVYSFVREGVEYPR